MLRLLNILWLKNVNNLRNTNSIICDYISTIYKTLLDISVIYIVKLQYKQLYLHYYSTNISTFNIYSYNLLNKSFTYYPQRLLIRLKKFKER